MSIVGKEDSSPWETSITYARDPVAVIIGKSVEIDRAEVELIRMVAGQNPLVPILVHPETPIDRCESDNLSRNVRQGARDA